MTPPAWWLRTLAYLFVVGLSVFAVWQVDMNARAGRLDDKAHDCVISWKISDRFRDAVGIDAVHAPRTSTEILIEFAGPRATPEQIDRLRKITAVRTAADAAAVRALIPNPACDLQAAKRRLDQ